MIVEWFTICFMNNEEKLKFVFSPDVIPCGWLGSKHQLTNYFKISSCAQFSFYVPCICFISWSWKHACGDKYHKFHKSQDFILQWLNSPMTVLFEIYSWILAMLPSPFLSMFFYLYSFWPFRDFFSSFFFLWNKFLMLRESGASQYCGQRRFSWQVALAVGYCRCRHLNRVLNGTVVVNTVRE